MAPTTTPTEELLLLLLLKEGNGWAPFHNLPRNGAIVGAWKACPNKTV